MHKVRFSHDDTYDVAHLCSTDPADLSVLIEGESCDIDEDSLSDTNIECAVPAKTWIKDDIKPVVRKRETAGGRRKKRNANTTYWYKRAVGVNI